MNNLNKLSEQDERELITIKAASEGFPEYCVAIDPRYSLEWFHQIIGLRLERAVKQVENGEDVRLMIFMPPRHGKSDEATQKFPSWTLGQHPEWPFIVASYSQELATDFGQGTRDLMERPNYKAIFDTRLREDTTAKAKWMTGEGGGYTAVGVGGAITGRGFKVGIVDDPFKNREEADSPVTRESVHKWWRSTFYTRQEGNTLIVLILTRWHDDDLAGRLLKEQVEAEKNGETDYDKWEVLEFKAIAERDEVKRKKGEALWPSKFDVPKLNVTKAALGSYEWSALYQQNPIDEENQEFKKAWLQYRSWEEIQAMRTRNFATIDSALSKSAKSDFTGVTRNYVNHLNEWNISSRRYKINSNQLIDLVFTLFDEGMEVIGIEEGAYLSAVEPFLKEEMERRGKYPNVVTLKHGQVMKETRIRGLIPRYENKKIFHIGTSCADLEEEYLRFPKSAHDDCLDSEAYQNDIALPPVEGEGDTISADEILKNVTDRLNAQADRVIIGASISDTMSYCLLNKEGLFNFNSIGEGMFKELDGFLKHWPRSLVIAHEEKETVGLRELQATYPGRVFIANLKGDSQAKEPTKWGEKDEWGKVTIDYNRMLQLVLGQLREKGRLFINGTVEEWTPFAKQFENLYRTKEETPLGTIYTWSNVGPDSWIKSLVCAFTGYDKFANMPELVTDSGADWLSTLKTGRIV